MTVKEEMEYAEKLGCKYIPPYKLAKMSELSNKIVKLLTDNVSAVSLCYDDMKIVLKIAESVIEKGVQKG